MEEWNVYKIGDVCNTISDTYKNNAESVVLINTSDVLEGKCLNHVKTPNKNLKGQFKKSFQKDDILYSEIRPANRRYAYIDFNATDYIASTKLMVIRHNKRILPQYLFYILKSQAVLDELQMLAESRSGTFPQITFSEVANMTIKLPPIEQQHRILGVLKSLDDKIENNRRINENLEQQAQALFKSWFVDFEPFKDGEFVESELGMIPKGWRVGTLGEVLNLRKDSYKKGSDLTLPYMPIDIIPMHSLGVNEFKDNKEAQSSLQTFEKNDIIIGAMRVYFHRVVIAPCKGITRNTCFVLKPKNNIMWAYCILECNQDEAINYANRTSKGSTMPYAVWENGFADYSIVIPPDSVLEMFNLLVSPILEKIRDSYKESRRLAELRDTLLPKLMSGELKVNEVEI